MGSGEIIVVSPIAQKAVVDVIKESKPHIIGGKLAPDAILMLGDRKTDLNFFWGR